MATVLFSLESAEPLHVKGICHQNGTKQLVWRFIEISLHNETIEISLHNYRQPRLNCFYILLLNIDLCFFHSEYCRWLLKPSCNLGCYFSSLSHLDVEATPVSSKPIASHGGGMKLEVIYLQCLQSHRRAFYEKKKKNWVWLSTTFILLWVNLLIPIVNITLRGCF